MKKPDKRNVSLLSIGHRMLRYKKTIELNLADSSIRLERTIAITEVIFCCFFNLQLNSITEEYYGSEIEIATLDMQIYLYFALKLKTKIKIKVFIIEKQK
jgi:hypothetical protein